MKLVSRSDTYYLIALLLAVTVVGWWVGNLTISSLEEQAVQQALANNLCKATQDLVDKIASSHDHSVSEKKLEIRIAVEKIEGSLQLSNSKCSVPISVPDCLWDEQDGPFRKFQSFTLLKKACAN